MTNSLHIVLFLLALALPATLHAQNVGINTTGATPDGHAILDISATDKGILIPRTDTATVTAAGVSTGLLIYQSTDNTFYYHNGSRWIGLKTGGNTLDQAYDENGAAAGRTIVADSGAVEIAHTLGTAADLFEVSTDTSTAYMVVGQTQGNSHISGLGSQWQSFTMPSYVTLTTIELKLGNTHGKTLSLYKGVGTSGTLLASNYQFFGGSGGWKAFDFAGIQLQAGQSYTLATDAHRWLFHSADPYAEGYASHNATTDFLFRINATNDFAGFHVSSNAVRISDYTMPIEDGAAGQLLTTDGAGNVAWASQASDNMGNHTATANVQLSGNWLSNDGGNEGIFVATNGSIGLNTDPGAVTATTEANSNDGLIELVLRGQAGGNLVAIDAQGSGSSTMDLMTKDGSGHLTPRVIVRGNADISDVEFVSGSTSAHATYAKFEGENKGLLIGSTYAPNNTVPADGLAVEGNVGIGVTSTTHKLQVAGTAGLSTGTAWTNTSDARLKNVHGNYTHGLDAIMQLRTVTYNYKEGNALDLPHDITMVGFVAQEVEQVIPEAVVHTDAHDYLQLNVDPIHWAAINAIQEQQRQIEALKKEIESLRQQAEGTATTRPKSNTIQAP